MILKTKFNCLHEKSNTVSHSSLNTSECQFLLVLCTFQIKNNYYVRSDCLLLLVCVVLTVNVFIIETLQIFIFFQLRTGYCKSVATFPVFYTSQEGSSCLYTKLSMASLNRLRLTTNPPYFHIVFRINLICYNISLK
jgi:hypothetical protein